MNNFAPPCSTAQILLYQPAPGDYIIWSRWFSTWHGFLVDMDKDTLTFIMAGLPSLLVSLSNSGKSMVKLNLIDIRNSTGGKFAIIRHIREQDRMMWYV